MKTHNIRKEPHPENLRKLIKPAALCISALFIISMLSALAFTPVQAIIGTSASNTFRWYPRATPTPTPASPSASSTTSNLTPFPLAWESPPALGGTVNGGLSCAWGVSLDSGDTIDKSVLYNGNPTIKVAYPFSHSTVMECDGPWLTVHPGDHVVFSVWMKTTNGCGGRSGIDFYGAGGGRISGTNSPTGKFWNPVNGYPSDNEGTYVPVNSGWTKVTIDFIVPATICADPWSSYSSGTYVAPAAMAPWVQGWLPDYNPRFACSFWFAATQLYINP